MLGQRYSTCILYVYCIYIVWFAEVVADDTPAIDAVVKADKKRLELLAKKDELEAAATAGEDKVDELKEVSLFNSVQWS